jgi:acetyl-CoA carboxylase biotin carboxyl carrier protein
MELDKIRELVQLVEDSQIQELELSHRGETIRIAKASSVGPATPVAAPVVPATAPTPEAPAAEPAPEPAAPGGTGREVVSPIVGTFYRAPSPEASDFVEVGQHVDTGDVLCIVEAMKVMNEIEAEFSGTVREVLAENGQPVEFGQALFVVEPD